MSRWDETNLELRELLAAYCDGLATAEQVRQLVDLFAAEQAHYRQDPKAAQELAADPLGPLPAGMDAADLAAWTVVANVLLNLDGVLTKG